MKKILTTFAFLSLIGCYTNAVNPEKANAVDPLLFTRPTEVNNVSITVIRDSGLSGFACSYNLYFQDQLVARLDTSEKTTFYLPPGDIYIGLDSCIKGIDTGTFIHVKPKDKIQMRTGITTSGDMFIRRVK